MMLDEDAVRGLLRMQDLIPVMASALADPSRGKVVQPVRVVVPIAEHQGFLADLPRRCRARDAGGADHRRLRETDDGDLLLMMRRPEEMHVLVRRPGFATPRSAARSHSIVRPRVRSGARRETRKSVV